MNITTTTLRQITFLVSILLLLSNNVHAQKFGKIDKERLQEAQHPLDPDASFAYIFKNCETSYDLQTRSARLITNYHYRIKIYDEEGVDQANIVRYLYRNKGDRENIKGIKAECHNWVDGKDVKTKLSKKEVFKEELDENITKVSFAIPNARAGSIIEFRFRIVSPFLYSTPRHYFQEDVPVDYSNFKIDVPGYFTMAPSATGSIPLNKKEEEKFVFGANVSQFVFDVSDVPAIEEDKYVLDINDYRSSLKYELSVVDFPGSETQNFTKDWNSICKNLMKSDYFGKAIKKKVKPANDLLDSIKSMEEGEKLNKIVDFINTNIVWDKNVGKYGADSYNELFREKSGDVAEINLLLINLCKKAGLTAYPVLTKYRFHGILNTLYPSLTEINYVFALIEVDGSPIFVDATSPYFEPGTLPLRALNIQGVLITDEGSQIIELKNTNLNYNKMAGKYTINLDEGRLDGTGIYKMKQYASVMARKKAVEENDDEDQQDLIKELDGGDEEEEEDDEEEEEDIVQYNSVKGFDDKYGEISSKFDAQLFSPYETIGNEIYVDAFVTLEFEENPFIDEKREFPAFFNSKHHLNHVATISIPEGYVVKSRPENISLKMINNKGLFNYMVQEGFGKITINALFKINDDIFFPAEYASLYAFFDQVLKKQKEKIVLVKE